MVDIIEYSIYLGLYGNLDFNTQVEPPPLTYKEYSEVEDRKALLSSIKNRITNEESNKAYLQEFEDGDAHISDRTGIPIYDLYVKAD